MPTKRKVASLFLVPILAIGLTGCGIFNTGKVTDYVPITFSNENQDQVTAGLIGREYLDYRQEAGELTDEDVQVVTDWADSGSTWSTYEHIVGQDGDEGYIVFVNEDPDLTEAGVLARTTEVEAWYLNLEVRLGAPEWEGGDE